jgi:predicted amidohydrolase
VTRVACRQFAPRVDDRAATRAALAAALASGAAAGADVLVLPELANTGYVFAGAEEARAGAEPLDGPTLTAWHAAAARHGMVVCGGFCEAGDDGRLYNSAALVDATGVRAVYRKAHLWDRERDVFTPGAAPPPVVETEHGRLAMIVCYDLEFPEWPRVAALAGADLLLVPTNWPSDGPFGHDTPMEVLRAMVAAATNHMFVAVCDRHGAERGVEWVAGTAIAGTDGALLAGPAGPGDALLVADIDLAAARDKSYGASNDVHADRRPELYGPLADRPVVQAPSS